MPAVPGGTGSIRSSSCLQGVYSPVGRKRSMQAMVKVGAVMERSLGALGRRV